MQLSIVVSSHMLGFDIRHFNRACILVVCRGIGYEDAEKLQVGLVGSIQDSNSIRSMFLSAIISKILELEGLFTS